MEQATVKRYEDVKKDEDKEERVKFGKLKVISDFGQNTIGGKVDGHSVGLD